MHVVTGASGFIGSHVVDRLLDAGKDTVACVRKTSDRRWLDGKPVSLREVDLDTGTGLAEALAGAKVVYHVAGVTRSADAEAFRKGNCENAVRLARAALKASPGLDRFVYVSSLAASGPARDGRPLCETDPLRPVSSYGVSKRDAERELRAVEGLPLVVVRPPIVYGPRDTNLLALFRVASKRVFPVAGSGLQELSFVFGPDLAGGIAAASEAPVDGAYFLTGGSADWLRARRAMQQALKRRTLLLPLPALVLRAVGEFFERRARFSGVPHPLNRRKIGEMLEPCWTCSGDRAREDFGFRPSVSLEEGFRRTAAWYREAGWL